MKRICLCILLFLTCVSDAFAWEPEIFSIEYNSPGVAGSFVAGGRWLPYPEYSDRDAWTDLFGPDAADAISRGEKYLEYEWKTIPATAYLAFERTGDRSDMQSREGANRSALTSLIVAELAEGQGRFIDQIANGVWLTSQQFSWVLSAHQGRQETGRALPDPREQLIDLGSGRFSSVVCFAYYFFHDKFDELDPSISYAVEEAVRRNILDPFLDVEKYTSNWWIGLVGGDKVPGLNNWTPWCNSDVILAFLLVEKDQSRLDVGLSRSVESMDMFLRSVQSDGACEEGPSYWGHAAGKVYDWMQIMYDASGGAFDVFDNERIRRMGEYISRAYVGSGYVVNFADASARLEFVPELVWNYGNAVGSSEMKDFALYCLADADKGRFRYPSISTEDSFRTLETIRFNHIIRDEVDSLNALVGETSFEGVLQGLRREVPQSTWYAETEQCYLRNSSRWFLGAKGGYNAESHNHNDIGSCILYIRDIPVLIDAGVGTYTRQTFGAERYTIWTMQCDWHNLPMINGAAQPFGQKCQSKNVSCTTSKGEFSLDLADAYPEEACCGSWTRTYRLAMSGKPSVTISDAFSLTGRTGADVEHFLVKGDVLLPGEIWQGTAVKEGEILILCDVGLVVRLAYPDSLKASVDEMPLDDVRLSRVWGPSIHRINLSSSADAPVKGVYKFRLEEVIRP